MSLWPSTAGGPVETSFTLTIDEFRVLRHVRRLWRGILLSLVVLVMGILLALGGIHAVSFLSGLFIGTAAIGLLFWPTVLLGARRAGQRRFRQYARANNPRVVRVSASGIEISNQLMRQSFDWSVVKHFTTNDQWVAFQFSYDGGGVRIPRRALRDPEDVDALRRLYYVGTKTTPGP